MDIGHALCLLKANRYLLFNSFLTDNRYYLLVIIELNKCCYRIHDDDWSFFFHLFLLITKRDSYISVSLFSLIAQILYRKLLLNAYKIKDYIKGVNWKWDFINAYDFSFCTKCQQYFLFYYKIKNSFISFHKKMFTVQKNELIKL